MAFLEQLLTWEMLLTLFGIMSGWIATIWQRLSGRKQIDELKAGQQELLKLVREMPGKSTEEQRKIVEAAELIPVRFGFSVPEPKVTVTRKGDNHDKKPR